MAHRALMLFIEIQEGTINAERDAQRIEALNEKEGLVAFMVKGILFQDIGQNDGPSHVFFGFELFHERRIVIISDVFFDFFDTCDVILRRDGFRVMGVGSDGDFGFDLHFSAIDFGDVFHIHDFLLIEHDGAFDEVITLIDEEVQSADESRDEAILISMELFSGELA